MRLDYPFRYERELQYSLHMQQYLTNKLLLTCKSRAITHHPNVCRWNNTNITLPKLTFYWILETSRRRLIHLTLLLITGLLAIFSEILQALLPNDRDFDPFDILANVLGSGLALAACSWYHRRMLERRRRNKHYNAVPGEDEEGLGGEEEGGERDVELGDVGEQETGRIAAEDGQAQVQAGEGAKRTVTEELDNWDENAEDEWEETDADASAAGKGGK